jgi:hypothetical protein
MWPHRAEVVTGVGANLAEGAAEMAGNAPKRNKKK